MSRKYKLLLLLCVGLFNEFLADYVVIWQCRWPKLTNDNVELRALIMADPHLLGPFRGHWLDKLYREWHMMRAFQAAMSLLQPQVVFVLGDLFDEGDFVNDAQFKAYVQRFHSHFKTPPGIPLISAAGNHDIGFHYKLHHLLTDRFDENFNNTGVKLYTIKGMHFVVVNSMAMQNDGCEFCQRALHDLHEISTALGCLKDKQNCKQSRKLFAAHDIYSQPIVLQHFPTYRSSDLECQEHDSLDIEKYRETWEVLSKKSTDLLGRLLNPRILFAGHSHSYCLSRTRFGAAEHTVASFSWRNKINPSFMLASFTAEEHAASKCNMLTQTLVYNVYQVTMFLLSLLSIFDIAKLIVKRLQKQKFKANKFS